MMGALTNMNQALNFRQEDMSQLIRWGHWFTFLNIVICLVIGSGYPILSDWPSTFLGRFYAIASTLGQFAFLTFLLYIIIAFPLTFILRSYRQLRLIFVLIATLGLTILCCDLVLFAQFKLHLSRYVIDLLLSDEYEGSIFNGYLLCLLFIAIFLFEYLLATLSWRKLRSLHKRKVSIAVPIVALCIGSFLFSHLVHIWADANFYRPITMQRKNLPLSYPLTARHLLGKYGLIDESSYQQRLLEQGDPFSMSIEYPLQKIRYQTQQPNPYNILLVTINGIKLPTYAVDMPILSQFAQNNLNFTAHLSAGIDDEIGAFSLFYGIAPNFYDAVIVGRKHAVFMDALADRNYQVGFFSMKGFNSPLYRQALLSDFTVPSPHFYDENDLFVEWKNWLARRQEQQPWFSYLTLDVDDSNNYAQKTQQINQVLTSILTQLSERQLMNNTVVVITSNHAYQYDQNATYGKAQLQVPLMIHWPGEAPRQIAAPTGHIDITRTLLQNVLAVENTPSYYTQGANLFTPNLPYHWLYAGDNKNLVVVTNEHIIRLERRGKYTVYNHQYQRLDDIKLPVSELFKLLKESRRFAVH